MAVRVIAIANRGVLPSEREQLPRWLSQAFRRVLRQAKSLQLSGDPTVESNWKWDWNSAFDGTFEAWLGGRVVGLSWPAKDGISVLFTNNCIYVSTGVRWDVFLSSKEARNVVEDIVRVICETTGAERTLFVPDAGELSVELAQEMFFDGRLFDDIEATARKVLSNK